MAKSIKHFIKQMVSKVKPGKKSSRVPTSSNNQPEQTPTPTDSPIKTVIVLNYIDGDAELRPDPYEKLYTQMQNSGYSLIRLRYISVDQAETLRIIREGRFSTILIPDPSFLTKYRGHGVTELVHAISTYTRKGGNTIFMCAAMMEDDDRIMNFFPHVWDLQWIQGRPRRGKWALNPNAQIKLAADLPQRRQIRARCIRTSYKEDLVYMSRHNQMDTRSRSSSKPVSPWYDGPVAFMRHGSRIVGWVGDRKPCEETFQLIMTVVRRDDHF